MVLKIKKKDNYFSTAYTFLWYRMKKKKVLNAPSF